MGPAFGYRWIFDRRVYTIDVTVGDGSVTLPILVDSGSADIWVAGSNCDNCTSSGMADSGLTATDNCQEQEKGYGSGSVKGCLVPTDVKFGDGYELEAFPVLVASDSEGFDRSYMSGIFGLAMNKSSINNQATPLNMMSQLGMISTPEVGFYLDRAETGSEIIFGSPHDDNHADQSKKVTLPKVTEDDGLYRVTMDGFVSHGYMVSSTESNVSMENIEVILDTGTSDIRVPDTMMLPIYAALGNGTFFTDTTTGDLVVPCEGPDNKDEALALQFGGQQFYFKWEDLVANPSSTDANYCYCRVQASPSSISDYLIVGSAFFHNVYHVINIDSGYTTLYGLADVF
ncbi:endopeptidase [Cryptococcus wingfieldii CBS 7118]|uniref:Endopeptidase n=1 Tax=Cryptococcus wingfieldii CBS 7118 TaxID=1295528 RepID=A0A1E3JRN2_9TREE|nr:endopeptidase [Cryptococcus wingfieldii CBS 7118]ODO03539.1 endopeptidase [Cryptococcus wingfieldii CBS 7118]